MASILAPFPRFVFAVFEPLSLVAGFIGVFMSPEWFVSEQIAGSSLDPITQNARLVTLQLGNIYLLMFFMGVGILYSTTQPNVVRNYLKALWLGDIGHAAVTYYVIGHKRAVDVANWNAMTWGNIGATLFLFTVRSVYLLGYLAIDPKKDSKGAKKT